MISYVVDKDYTILGDELKGIYTFSLQQNATTIAQIKFELISEGLLESLDLSEDAFEADDELSLLLAISPISQVWRVFDLNTVPEFKTPTLFVLTTMQMLVQQNKAYLGSKSSVIAFIKDVGSMESIWATLGEYPESFVFSSKNTLALI